MVYNPDRSCPKCDSHYIELITGGEAWMSFKCETCGCRWREDYFIVGRRARTRITKL